jgi:hypothetical protein
MNNLEQIRILDARIKALESRRTGSNQNPDFDEHIQRLKIRKQSLEQEINER